MKPKSKTKQKKPGFNPNHVYSSHRLFFIHLLHLQFQNICCNFIIIIILGKLPARRCLVRDGDCVQVPCCPLLSHALPFSLEAKPLSEKANGIKGLGFAGFDFFFLSDLFCQPRHLWVIHRGRGTYDQCCAVTTCTCQHRWIMLMNACKHRF
jgi:hypothetical protein